MSDPHPLAALPVFSSKDWELTLAAAGDLYRQLPPNPAYPFFIQIGAMDGQSFDPIYPLISKGGLPGLLVEPLPDHFASLQETYRGVPGLRFEQAAITDRDGTVTMHRISDAAVVAGAVPEWMGAIATTMPDRGIIGGKHFRSAEFQPYIDPNLESLEVPSLTVPSLLAKHGIAHAALLMLDVEGAEWQILQQVDLARLQPTLVYVEHDHMPADEAVAVLEFFNNARYTAYRGSQDLLFIKA